MNEINMQVEGDTNNEKAKSLVRAMLEAGLAEKLRRQPLTGGSLFNEVDSLS